MQRHFVTRHKATATVISQISHYMTSPESPNETNKRLHVGYRYVCDTFGTFISIGCAVSIIPVCYNFRLCMLPLTTYN